jgi:UDP-N-acetylglucosamine 4-epimerase
MKDYNKFSSVIDEMKLKPNTWLITGAAGFIGSNLVEFLLTNNQFVIGIDNFSTGHQSNLDDVKNNIDEEHWMNFIFIDGDIRDMQACEQAYNSSSHFHSDPIDFVLHQAAIGSVPRSIEDPIFSHSNNISGFLNVLFCAKERGVKKFVYATSSSVYGDEPSLPKVEKKIGNLLSPYALTKLTNELYAKVFTLNYDLQTVGLRYFNVFGPRQDPNGAYAAVIPKWINRFILNKTVEIYGDGKTTRDFCYIENVIQANILAAKSTIKANESQVFNIAVGSQINLMDLALLIKQNLTEHNISSNFQIENAKFRKGDIRHSLADISNARKFLSYKPSHTVEMGLKKSMAWYLYSANEKD